MGERKHERGWAMVTREETDVGRIGGSLLRIGNGNGNGNSAGNGSANGKSDGTGNSKVNENKLNEFKRIYPVHDSKQSSCPTGDNVC